MGCTHSTPSSIHTPTDIHPHKPPQQSSVISDISPSVYTSPHTSHFKPHPSDIIHPTPANNNNNTRNSPRVTPDDTMTTAVHQHSSDTVAAWLKGVPLLAKLNDQERVKLGEKLIEKQYKSGQTVFAQGDEGHGFYIVISGDIQVSVDNAIIATLHAGDYFGEQSLISQLPRAATCTAMSANTRLFYLSRDLFHQLFGYNRLNIAFVKRAAISAETTAQARTNTVTAPANANRVKTPEQNKLIYAAMNTNILFMNVDNEHKQLLINEMYTMPYKTGQSVIQQGDYGDNLYIVETGMFDILVNGKKVASRGVGTCFGELALMYNAKRAATVTAIADSQVYVIDRFTFRRIVTDMSERKYITYINFLKKVDLLSSLAEYERKKIAEALDEVSVNSGSSIFKQNDSADAMYIVYTGSVKIVKKVVDSDKSKHEEIVQTLTSGNVFGERALHTNETRAATAIALQDTVLLRLDRAAFVLLLGPLEDILKQKVVEYKEDDVKRQHTRHTLKSTGSDGTLLQQALQSVAKAKADQQQSTYVLPKRDTLKVIGTLGKGSFGFVQLVQDPASKMTYALKAVNKTQIVQTGQQHHVISEKQSMLLFDHPFLIKLYGTYKDQQRLYFLLQPVLGGELFTVLRERTLFDENTARFYAAQIVLSFEYMHDKHSIVYRDLKPENLLLDADGYLKITDFGFAKNVAAGNRTWTLCGTPDYLAPEIVSGKGHNKAVDWWTLGIFIYEMLASYPPFYNEDPMKTYSKIMEGHIHYPSHFSRDVVDLIGRLLQPRVSKRLGMLAGNANDIKQHPWFKATNWDNVLNRKVTAPIIPKIKSQLDVSNFENYGNETQKVLPYVDDGSKWDADF